MTVDEFDTASCARCSHANDEQFRSVIERLQAENFAYRPANEDPQEHPVDAEALKVWLADVDEETLAMVGMKHDQLPSWYWADSHAAGLSAHEAAHFAVEDAHRDAVVEGWYLARYAEVAAEGGEVDG